MCCVSRDMLLRYSGCVHKRAGGDLGRCGVGGGQQDQPLTSTHGFVTLAAITLRHLFLSLSRPLPFLHPP